MHLGIKLKTPWKSAWKGHFQNKYNFYSILIRGQRIYINKGETVSRETLYNKQKYAYVNF